MNPVFGTPQGTGVGAHRRDRHADADREDVGELRVPLMLVDDGKATRIVSPSIPDTGSMPRNAGSIIE